jgi:hypothetical protein
MTVTDQNCLLVFKKRVFRKIYGPTQDKDGAWRLKSNEELEYVIKKKKYCKIYTITMQIMLRCTRNQNAYTKNCQKINWMGTMFIKSSRKTKTEMAWLSRRGFKEDGSEKLETEVSRQKNVERNRKAGQNPPRVVAPTEEEDNVLYM